ncbi:spore germination protein [Cytobacillus oceanisediminis]|uniref:spore germination protein n=1 Tax=Cytobacillus oceanisediminis TaxID=665099 RepID=UPI0023DA5EA8|nr:spore germination protein [Cytobacillus oceanisediminis]MDF2038405.1 spore germination protein [Cytobacillus oceanisediminis]
MNQKKSAQPLMEKTISKDIDSNLKLIKKAMFDTDEIKERTINIHKQKLMIVYLDSMVDKQLLENNVIEPLIEAYSEQTFSGNDLKSSIMSLIKPASVNCSAKITEIVNGLRTGASILLIENEETTIIASVPTTEDRSIQEPENEKIVKGPRDGFTESLNKNIYLLQKRNKYENLVAKNFEVGEKSKTKISLLYMDDLVDRDVLFEVIDRIQKIKVERVQSSGELEELIEDRSFTIFPQVLTTERPDRASSYLLEGKVIIIIDGNPQILVLSITFFSFYQSPDDYNNRWLIGSFFRLIRLLSFLIAISLPAMYISVVSFHSEILPIGLLYALRVQTEFIPLTPFLEAIIMQIILELLKEAAIRLPAPIAQTIGIVGGLVIGTAIVEAGLVSNVMIVVVALTAIASFVAPVNQMGTGVRMLAFPIMIMANLFGFLGITVALTTLLIHLCKLESFKTPYMYPIAPLNIKGIKDVFIRPKKKAQL